MDELYDLIRRFEGFRSKPYLCPAGVPTIGYGSTGRDITLDHPPVTREWAEARMRREADAFAQAVLAVSPILAQHPSRWAAIADFAYNLGTARYKGSTLRRKVAEEDWTEAARQINKWVFGGGRKLPGLIIRRAVESQMILHPKEKTPAPRERNAGA